jgi:hypothetical protein
MESLMRTSNSSDDRAVAVSNLWRYYDEHATQARQHETLRASVTSTLAAISAAVVGLAGIGGFNSADVPAGLVVILISALGVALSLKHHERNRLHYRLLKEIREEIDKASQGTQSIRSTGDVRQVAENDHNSNFSVWRRRLAPQLAGSQIVRARLHLLWACLPLGIGVVGVLIVALALIGVAR